MDGSVAEKAIKLIDGGRVLVEDVDYNKMTATVVSSEIEKDESGELKRSTHQHSVLVWRDGHYSCTCTNFTVTDSEHYSLWGEKVWIKPECKHALAVKLSPEYERWIRMYLVPTEDGYALRAIEGAEQIHVKSTDEKISKDRLLPKVKSFVPRVTKGKIPFDKIFGN